MNKYDKADKFTHDDFLATCNLLPKEENEYIVETAGFVPLEVKLKQFEQNGMIAQFNTAEFTSNDYREMYLNPDFDITPEDDFEEIQDKIEARNEFIKKYQMAKSNGQETKKPDEKAGTEEPDEKLDSQEEKKK